MGDLDRAIADFSEAVRLDPMLAAAWMNRGLAYEGKGEDARGRAADFDQTGHGLRLAISMRGTRAVGRARSAGVQLQQAVADCNEALKLSPDNADATDSRGFVHLKLGDFDHAIEDYDAALQINSQLASSLYGRGIARGRKGDADGAKADIAAARALRGSIADEFASYGIK